MPGKDRWTLFIPSASIPVLFSFQFSLYFAPPLHSSLSSIQMARQTVSFSPGPREMQRDCIKYWVVVVSVVIGIFALVVIVIILAMVSILPWIPSAYYHRLLNFPTKDISVGIY